MLAPYILDKMLVEHVLSSTKQWEPKQEIREYSKTIHGIPKHFQHGCLKNHKAMTTLSAQASRRIERNAHEQGAPLAPENQDAPCVCSRMTEQSCGCVSACHTQDNPLDFDTDRQLWMLNYCCSSTRKLLQPSSCNNQSRAISDGPASVNDRQCG